MVFHCFLIFLQKKRPIMLDAPSIVLCSKLCRHNVSDPRHKMTTNDYKELVKLSNW